MALYSIFAASDAGEPPEAVPDRFSWFAFVLPPLYLLVHGLWLALLGFVVGVAAIAVAGLAFGEEAGMWLYLLFALLIGFEAAALRRGKLRRRLAWRGERAAGSTDAAMADYLGDRSEA